MPGYFRLTMHCRKRCMHRAVRRELASGCARYPIQSNGNLGAEGSRDGITENARSYSRSVTLSRADHGRAWKLCYSLLERGRRVPHSPGTKWNEGKVVLRSADTAAKFPTI